MRIPAETIRQTKKQRLGPINQNKTPEINLNGMQIHEPPDKGFKIMVIEMFNELQENADAWLKEIRKMMHKQNRVSSKETETIKKNETNSGAEKYKN